MTRRSKQDALVFPVAIAVLVGWMAALGFGIATAQYTPLTIVTPVMLMLAGYVFGVGIIRSKDGNGERG